MTRAARAFAKQLLRDAERAFERRDRDAFKRAFVALSVLVDPDRAALEEAILADLDARGGSRAGSLRSVAWRVVGAERVYEIAKRMRDRAALVVGTVPGARFVRRGDP